MNTIANSDQPGVFGVEWERLSRLYLGLVESGVDPDGPFSDQICWTAGAYYACTFLLVGLRQGSTTSPSYEVGKLEKICSSAASRLDRVFRSRPVASDVASLRDCSAESKPLVSFQIAFMFQQLAHDPREWLPKKAQAYLNEEPKIENRIRFYFGLGFVSILGASRQAVWAYIKDGGNFIVPNDETGERTLKLRELIKREFCDRNSVSQSQ